MNGSSLLFCFIFSATTDAASLYQLFIYFLIAAAFVFLAVTGFITYILIKYRARKNDDENGEPPQIHGNKKVEISLTLLAAGLVGFFFYLTVATMLRVNQPAGSQQADVKITAFQWWWQAEYPKSGAVTANEIHIPAGKKILVKFTSADVIHDWWVPDLGRKMDIFPGRTTHLWIEVDKAGRYIGACSEFCGAQHAWMRIRVIVQPQDEFDRWQKHNARPALAEVSSDRLAAMGEKLFNRKTCGNCHTIRGTKNSGKIGPDLTHVASRKTLLTGKILNSPENMHRWIKDPQKVKEGAHMPRFILEENQVKALVTYMESLK